MLSIESWREEKERDTHLEWWSFSSQVTAMCVGSLLSYGWLNMGSREVIPRFILLECMAFALAINLLLPWPMRFFSKFTVLDPFSNSQWNDHKIIEWFGTERTIQLSQSPGMERNIFYYNSLLWAPFSVALGNFSDAAPSLGNLIQYLTTPITKIFLFPI